MRFSSRVSILTALLQACVFEIVPFVTIIGSLWIVIAVVTGLWHRVMGRRGNRSREHLSWRRGSGSS